MPWKMESFVTVISEDESKASLKMLTQTLRQLERDGLVKREITPSVPPIVEYSLTPLGVSLLEPMRALNRWMSQNYVWVEKARASYDQVDQTE